MYHLYIYMYYDIRYSFNDGHRIHLYIIDEMISLQYDEDELEH